MLTKEQVKLCQSLVTNGIQGHNWPNSLTMAKNMHDGPWRRTVLQGITYGGNVYVTRLQYNKYLRGPG